jgi:hypothetical protein
VNTQTKTAKWRWLGAALLATVGLAGTAHATNPAVLNIDVTITASKSVTVNGVASSTDSSVNWTGTPNQAFTGSTVTVKNDSGVLSEGWELSTNANSIDTTGGGQTWALAASSTSVGADQFAVQAVFGSSNTAASGCSSASWGSSVIAPVLTTTPTQYTTTKFADSALNNLGTYLPDSGNLLYAYNASTGAGLRALCWQTVMPTSTSTQNKQNIQVIVTAL